MLQTRRVQLAAPSWPASIAARPTHFGLCQPRSAHHVAGFTVYSSVSVPERVRICAEGKLMLPHRSCEFCNMIPSSDVVVCARQKEKLKSAKKAVEQLILSKHCNPIVVRLAWHDSGSYDKVCSKDLIAGTTAASYTSQIRPVCMAFASFCEEHVCRADDRGVAAEGRRQRQHPLLPRDPTQRQCRCASMLRMLPWDSNMASMSCKCPRHRQAPLVALMRLDLAFMSMSCTDGFCGSVGADSPATQG